jgi:hypothetical protein
MQPQDNSPFASVVGLGALKSEHKPKGAGRWIGPIMGLICILIAPATVLFAAWRGYDTYTNYGSSRVLEEVALPLICGGGAFLLGALLLWEAWRNWKLAAALYDYGLAFVDRKGLRQIRWEEMELVWQSVTKHYRNGIYTGTTHLYTIQTRDGSKIALDDKLPKVEDLGNAILNTTANMLAPQYGQALQNGQRLTFGPLAMDLQGLYSGNKALTWQEIKAVKLERGTLSVKKEKGWFNWTSVTVPQIPNFYVFYHLLGQFAKIE